MIVFMFPDSVSFFEICFAYIMTGAIVKTGLPQQHGCGWRESGAVCAFLRRKWCELNSIKPSCNNLMQLILYCLYIYIYRLMTSSNEYFSRTAWFSRNLEVSSRNWIPPGQEWFVSSFRFAVLVGYTVGQTATLDLSESGIQIWCVWPTYAFELWVVHGQTESAWQVQWPH